MKWGRFYSQASREICLFQTIWHRLLTNLSFPHCRPPDDINDVFSVMHYIQQDFKNVRKQFRDLLNVPQLQLLQVDDPFRNQAPAEQVGQLERVRESKVDLMQVICRFYKVRPFPMSTYLGPCC